MKLTQLNKDLLQFLFLILLLFPSFLLSTTETTNEFLYQNIAFTELMSSENNIYPKTEFGFAGASISPAYNFMLYTLKELAHIPARSVHFLPIGGIILPLLYYALSYKIFNSKIISSFFAFLIAYDLSQALTLYNVFAYTWAYALTLTFIIVLILLLKNKRPEYVLLLLLIFISTNYYHYTIPSWMIFFTLCVNLILIVSERIIKRSFLVFNKKIVSLTLVFFIFYLTFNKMIYNVYLPSISIDIFQQSLDHFFTKVFSIQYTTHLDKYMYLEPSNQALSTVRLLYYFSLLCPMLYIIVKYSSIIPGKLKGRVACNLTSSPQDELHFILVTTIIVIAFIDSVAYAAKGILSLKVVMFLFPLISVICVSKITTVKSRNLYLIFLVLLLLSKFILIANVGMIGQVTKYDEIEPGVDWYVQNTESHKSTILTDLDTLGKYLVIGSEQKKLFSAQYYDSKIYGSVVNENSTKDNSLSNLCDSIVIDIKSSNEIPIKSVFWGYYEPIGKYNSYIENNININKVYIDGFVKVFNPS